ncbi:pentatricopeptide repeat-containing protein At5g66520-like [Olea europaea var. sylvestris]|uniref:pentatricopeptide repeat-containing protein At5g66520-like n=1 Tax=Olea europaea var. sylvestris TaxID=158386 RepID=UPI000C1D65F3|nr:pentatricopeptide repeat-containing protein At5g66520-like [Olea europaea var. sylvestris]
MIESMRLNFKDILARSIHNCKSIRVIKQIHSHIITSPNLSPNDHYFLISRLLFFLCTVNESPDGLKYAVKVFRRIAEPSLFAYNAMIRASSTKIKDPFSCESLILYKEMLCNNLSPDSITIPFVLKECAKRVDGLMGRSIHAHAVKFGYEADVYVQNALISLYSEGRFLDDARRVFDEMSNRDIVSWNSMIVGYLRGGELDVALDLFKEMKDRKDIITWNSMITGFVQGGRPKEALGFFQDMQIFSDDRDMDRPDKITVASVLSACASLGAGDHGRWLHSYLERSRMECDMVIGTALVDMYGKCGCVERAFEVFNGMPKKDVLAWTAMISAFALHGHGEEAFKLFANMEAVGVRPNSVTFVGLLSACAHAGLVEKGRWCFDTMRRVYGIEPQVQHYACMVDILARAGQFVEAEDLIRGMPMEPDVFVWGALLGGCQLHGNVELGEKIAENLICLEPQNHAFYINLCDVYAKAGRFDDLKRIRALMKDKEIRKPVPGCSMIEVDGIVHEFSMKGSPEVPIMEAIKNVLMVLSLEMNRQDNMNIFIT